MLEAWRAAGFITKAILAHEHGRLFGNSHLQTGWIYFSEHADGDAALTEFLEQHLRPVLRLHTESGYITWAFQQPAVHSDEKKLFGYCYKVRCC